MRSGTCAPGPADPPDRRRRGESLQQLRHGAPAAGIGPARIQLRKRRQREATRSQARVGKDRVALLADAPPDVQQVDVDLAGAVDEAPRPSDAPLDFASRGEQGSGRSAPPDLYGRVPEVPLIAKADRLAAVERGDLPDPGEARDFVERPLEMPAAISDVRTEAEVGDYRRGRRIRSLLRRSRRSDCRRFDPLLRAPRRRRVLRLRRVRALHRTRRGFLPGGAP